MKQYPLCVIFLSIPSFCFAVSGQIEQPPNVVVFLADDMGLGDTSAYQDWTHNADTVQLVTPAMERLAAEGVRFTDAHSPSSRCSPTRYALLTGRYCWRTRLKHWVLFGVQCPPLIERERVTFPEFLQSAGYRTAMFGKWHLGLTYRNKKGIAATGWDDADLTQPLADGPLDHGFDVFFGISRSHGTSGPDGQKKNSSTQRIGPGWIDGRSVLGATGDGKKLDGSYQLHEVGQRLDAMALNFLEQASSEPQPFFLYFASPSNHSPYTPSDALGEDLVVGASTFKSGKSTNSKRLDFVYQNDVHIARLLDFLDRTPDPRRPGHMLRDNTLFLFSSDNGAEQLSKVCTGPLRSHKGSVYEGGHRVPFVACWPHGGVGDGQAETPGRDCPRLCALNDVFATVAEAIGKPLPPLHGDSYGAEDSISQFAAMQGALTDPRVAIFPNDHKEASRKTSDKRAWVAVRSNATPVAGQWKLFLDHRYAWQQKLFPQELYNLTNDLVESENLLEDPRYRPVVEFLLEQARTAAGDEGYTRQRVK